MYNKNEMLKSSMLLLVYVLSEECELTTELQNNNYIIFFTSTSSSAFFDVDNKHCKFSELFTSYWIHYTIVDNDISQWSLKTFHICMILTNFRRTEPRWPTGSFGVVRSMRWMTYPSVKYKIIMKSKLDCFQKFRLIKRIGTWSEVAPRRFQTTFHIFSSSILFKFFYLNWNKIIFYIAKCSIASKW